MGGLARRWHRFAAVGLLLGLAACDAPTEQAVQRPVTLGDNTTVYAPSAMRPEPLPQPANDLTSTQWPPARVGRGKALVSCERDDDIDPPRRLESLEFFSLVEAMATCEATGLVRLQYSGRIDAGFTDLVTRVSAMAERMNLPERILDIDSAGGQVEEAIEAGDAIAAAGWTIRVGEDAICHSSCVLVIASGDDRRIKGDVGVHRLMREGSKANSRAELNNELRNVNRQVRDYLQRHGVALTVSDLMMTVPNRELRLLTTEELDLYGLQGRNAVQDDLERILARRECGQRFVRRRDAFQRQYEAECGVDDRPWDEVARCGIELREAHGFPDPRCPGLTPLADAERRLRLQDEHLARLKAREEADGGASSGAGDSVSAPE